MIEKWYCLKCDNCGEVINYWCESSVKDAIERERNNGAGAVVLRNGECFCCKECRDESRERNKKFRKILRGENERLY